MGKSYKIRKDALAIFRASMRRAGIHCPRWARTLRMRHEFLKVYELARLECRTAKAKFHVDHITPLHGKHVSGLHVPWNLRVIRSEINLAKGTLIVDEWLPRVEEMPVDSDRLPWGGKF